MLTDAQKETYKKRLIADRDRLRAELRHQRPSLEEEHPGYSTHMADDATEVFEQTRDLALRRNMERDLEMIEEALERLEANTYGTCERCGQSIGTPRLDALPQVRFCMSCQTYLEKRYP
jgi:RNA polymerase-binding protein DksA